jgi:hypothetical protein
MCNECVEWGGKRWHRYNDGYYEYRGTRSLKRKDRQRLHRAVWESANGPVPEGYVIHHIDGNKGNNALENLEMVTKYEHTRIHAERGDLYNPNPINLPTRTINCVDCGTAIERQSTKPIQRCKKCRYKIAEARRLRDATCKVCGKVFRTRSGNFCSQRCVNVATNGGYVRVLPVGR